MIETQQNQKFIDNHQLIQLSERVVNNYVSKGSIPYREREDIMMGIVEKFLSKEKTIGERFKGDAKKETYCIAVLNRMCCEIIRKELKHWNLKDNEASSELASANLDTDISTLIADEVQFLKNILWMQNKDYHKLVLFLTYYFRLQVYHEDLANYSKNYEQHDLQTLLGYNSELSKGEIFIQLAEAVNRVEGKELKSDAVRMWLNKHMQNIIKRLNGPYFRAHYDKESFQILFEYFHLTRKSKK